jgi:hypothetical protein
VLPFFEEHDVKLLRVLTDRGSEFCGNPERHEYELYLAVEDIDHSRTKTKSPQTNGICERFHKTALNEFYRVAFRKKVYRSTDELQADLDAWIKEHQGRWCFGKTPMQTFLDGSPARPAPTRTGRRRFAIARAGSLARASASGGWGGDLRSAPVALQAGGAVEVQDDDRILRQQQRLDPAPHAAQREREHGLMQLRCRRDVATTPLVERDAHFKPVAAHGRSLDAAAQPAARSPTRSASPRRRARRGR